MNNCITNNMRHFQVPQVYTVLRYYGGKYYFAKYINKIQPPHKIFVDVFGGSGVIILGRWFSSDIEVYNDIFEPLPIFFSVIKDREKSKILQERLISILNQYKEYDDMREFYREVKEYILTNKYKNYSDIDVAIFVFYSINLSFSGVLKGKGFSTSGTKINKISTLKSKIDRISYASQRFENVIIENKDFIEIIEKYDSKDTLFYLDPPYVKESRITKKAYIFEMNDKQHEILVDILLSLKGKFILSGYDNSVYKRLEEKGINKYYKETVIKASNFRRLNVNERRKTEEIFWTNYTIPQEVLNKYEIIPYYVNHRLETLLNYSYQLQFF